MPYVSNDRSSGFPSEKMNYPIDKMRQAASQIMVDAGTAMMEHDAKWARIQSFIASFPGFMQGTIMGVLSPYAQRLRDSYQWQIDFANTLLDAANMADTTNQDVANSFKPRGFEHERWNIR